MELYTYVSIQHEHNMLCFRMQEKIASFELGPLVDAYNAYRDAKAELLPAAVQYALRIALVVTFIRAENPQVCCSRAPAQTSHAPSILYRRC